MIEGKKWKRNIIRLWTYHCGETVETPVLVTLKINQDNSIEQYCTETCSDKGNKNT